MVRWARHQIDAGRIPLDGWFPNLSFGLPQFHHYQSLPHVVAAYISLLFGVETTYYWSLLLLLALWPFSVYMGARLLGWDKWTSAGAAVFAPLVVSTTGYGFETGSYTWQGLGVWSQLWGMWTLPLALGFSWRAVERGKNYVPAAALVALTIAFHFIIGYLALLAIGVWVVVRPGRPWRRIARAALIGFGAVLVASWVIVPLVQDTAFSGNLEFYRGTFWFDSFGPGKVLGWLVTGEILDHGRVPVLSALAGLGAVLCVVRFRRDVRTRALLLFFVLALVLFCGRSIVGPIMNLLPGGTDLPLHRYIAEVQLAGLLLAGVALQWLGQGAWTLTNRYLTQVPRREWVAGAAVCLIAGVLLYPAWTQQADYDQSGAQLIANQQAQDSTDGADLAQLINVVLARGDGRAYGGTKANWGHQYAIGDVPVNKELENADVDQLGMWLNTTSLSSDVEARFDETRPDQYDLFNIRYLILPGDHPPPVPATLVARQGRHVLYQVQTTGFLEVVDTIGPSIAADRTDMGAASAGFLDSADLHNRRYPTVAFNGTAAAEPTSTGPPLSGRPGEVVYQGNQAADGIYGGFVNAARPAVVLLKVSYDPRWTATVDDKPVATQMVAPSFVAVPVPAGGHSVSFAYQPYPYYPELLALGALTLLGLFFAPRLRALSPTDDPAPATSSRSATKTPGPQDRPSGTSPGTPIL
jgi:hypothetical protein